MGWMNLRRAAPRLGVCHERRHEPRGLEQRDRADPGVDHALRLDQDDLHREAVEQVARLALGDSVARRVAPLDEHLDDVLPKRKAKCTTVCEGVSLKITLTEKFLVRTFESALIAPYLTAFNKKRTDEAPVAPSDVADVTVDGKSVIEKMQVRAMDVLTRDNHDVVLTL